MSGKTYTEEEIEATLAKSEELIKYSEDLLKAGSIMFSRLGIPRGTARRIMNHPEASESLKYVGMAQFRRWEDELGSKTNKGSMLPVARKKGKRNFIAL